MANPRSQSQCCQNPPTLNPSSGHGTLVKDIGDLNAYTAGSPEYKLAVLLVSDVFGLSSLSLLLLLLTSCLPTRLPFPSSLSRPRPRWHRAPPSFPAFKSKRPPCLALQSKEEEFVIGEDDRAASLPKEFYDEECQAHQRKKTAEWHTYRQKEEEKERIKDDEYREVGSRLKGYPEEEVRKAIKLVSSFTRSAEEVEQKIEEAAEKGEHTELVLMVIWNKLDLARRDGIIQLVAS